MIVADTGRIIALLDRDDRHHRRVRELFDEDHHWILPWAILPEVDYLAAKLLGEEVARAFVEDSREGLFSIDASAERDLPRAAELMDAGRAAQGQGRGDDGRPPLPRGAAGGQAGAAARADRRMSA